ncbi:MAG: DEAD/DEAH box helicase [Clostridia bacterium]|nr:DEAD/DEAH box helicase [Clostridia bacterium]
MDFATKASNLIKAYYGFKNKNEGSLHDIIIETCQLFDMAIEKDLTQGDYCFLRYMASEIGIPHYIDLLIKKKQRYTENYNLSDFGAIVQDSELFVTDDVMLHRYQKEVYNRFIIDEQNRFFLSAPTSFGKTYLVYQVITKMKYNNIVLIFPTIALLGENYLKILEMKKKSAFWAQYDIHTLSDEEFAQGKNIWIFTPERFMSYLDKHNSQDFDFIFIDEIYKIDNQYIIDIETIGENERDIAFRVALFDACLRAKDILLAGPYIMFPNENSKNCSLKYFLNDNGFEILDCNDIEIVDKATLKVNEKKLYEDKKLRFTIRNNDTKKKLETIVKAIQSDSEESSEKGIIIYCKRKIETENIAKYLIKSLIKIDDIHDDLLCFINHLSEKFGTDWIVANALRYGIGIHHGLVPKYIQREIINLFNKGLISILITTTTITEGVNTTAKNMIVMSSEKGSKPLKHFDAQNIAGRAGRFKSHFSGRVISIDNEFFKILEDDGDCLKHKGYDKESIKTDVDLDITKNEYLSLNDKSRKEKIANAVKESGIPDSIINTFKTISKLDKIELFKRIRQMNKDDRVIVLEFCQHLYYYFDWDGFDVICRLLLGLVKDSSLKSLMNTYTNKGHFLLTAKVYYYIISGFMGVLSNEISYYNSKKDSAIRNSAALIFNTFRYQLSKYLGLFDLYFRYDISLRTGEDMEKVPGLSVLIQRLEYGCITEKAKKANDYGVPFSIVTYYETNDSTLLKKFDQYENNVFNRIKEIL